MPRLIPRLLLLAALLVFFQPAGPAMGASLQDVLARTPAGAPVAMGRADMETGAGRADVAPRQRSRRVVVSGPAVLNQRHTEYVLDRDIETEGTAFSIRANHVTLNLNGHTVVYNQSEKGEGVSLDKWWLEDVQVINGTIRQGRAQSPGSEHGMGCNPIFSLSAKKLHLGGLRLEWSARDVIGLFVRGSKGVVVEACTLVDGGTEVSNRHQGLEALYVNGNDITVERVKVVSARQNGISIFEGVVRDCDVSLESVVTNSTGVRVGKGEIVGNRIVGRGVHPVGFWPAPRVRAYSNYVEVMNTASGSEYGSTGSAGMRIAWGKSDGIEIFCNTFLVRAEKNRIGPGEDSWGRAVNVGVPNPKQTASFHHNIIAAVNGGDGAKAAAVGVVANNKSPGLVFEKNIIASNWGALLLGDDYGPCDGFPVFRDNTIVKLPGGEDNHTIRSAYRDYASTALLVDNRYEGGAAPEDIWFELPSPMAKELRFARQVEVVVRDGQGQPVQGAEVSAMLPGTGVLDTAVSGADGGAGLALVRRRLVGERGNASLLTKVLGIGGGGLVEKPVDEVVLRVSGDGYSAEKRVPTDVTGPVEVRP
ncbi:carboxypeptidase-like regulatory domain-containing protein [Desulfohalovibrio reitneri]|uniref:carboxypeptidase-like regulatory domain-containing protein n=1 Tax=Desulfohalovibrio reitneri TaxID=1307759 RepID=UPI0004A75956|nr:carboxypeptidase-like regulatory domain-containing protein [Desulfohalovibrio reitneri]